MLSCNANSNNDVTLHVTQCNAVEEEREEDIEEDKEYIKEEEEDKNFSSKNNFENIPLNEMDAEAL